MPFSKREHVPILVAGIIELALGLIYILSDKPPLWIIAVPAIFIGALGIISIVNFLRKRKKNEQGFSLSLGILLLAVCGYLFLMPDNMWLLLPTIWGFLVLFDSVLKLELSIDLRLTDFRHWWIFVIAAVIMLGLSVLLIVSPFLRYDTARYYYGIILILNSFIGFATVGFSSFLNQRLVKNDSAQDEYDKKFADEPQKVIDVTDATPV